MIGLINPSSSDHSTARRQGGGKFLAGTRYPHRGL